MFRSRAIPTLALVVLLFSLPAACDSGGGDDDSLEVRISAVENGLLPPVVRRGAEPEPMRLRDRMAHWLTPGVSVAVINGGRIEWARGWGEAELGSGRAVTEATLFQACSVSKLVNAAGVMALVQDGRVDLDRNVNDQLHSWKVPDNEFTTERKVTPRRLLSHTGGLSVHGFGGYAPGAPLPTLPQILDGLPPANNAPVRVQAVPGSAEEYSGGGTTILQLLAQELTGDYPGCMLERILRPMGMDLSGFLQPLPESLAGTAARGHDMGGSPLPGGWHIHPELAAAGLWTTPTDLCSFALAVKAADSGLDGGPLSPATARAMLEAQTAGGGASNFGLGPILAGEGEWRSFRHDGANEGYRCIVFAYRDRGQGVAIMTNGSNGDALYMEILRAVSRVYGWNDFKPEEAALVDIPAGTLAALAGRYRLRGETPAMLDVAVTSSGLGLLVEGLSGVRSDLYPTSSDTFLCRSPISATITFTRDTFGTVTGLDLSPAVYGMSRADRL